MNLTDYSVVMLQPAPIELKVPFCCEGCEEKIQSHLIELEGAWMAPCFSVHQGFTNSAFPCRDVLIFAYLD